MPTDFTQLVYVIDLQTRRAYGEFLAWAKQTYLHSGSSGYAVALRDLIVTYVVIRVIAQAIKFIWTFSITRTAKCLYSTVVGGALAVFMRLPPVKAKVNREIEKAVEFIESSVIKNDDSLGQYPKLPPQGIDLTAVIEELHKLNDVLKHADWKSGRVSGAVYHGGDDLLQLQLEAYREYSIANQLHPDVFPGIRKMESEVVSMVLGLFNLPESAVGCTTSGGTESLLLTGLAAREYGRKKKGISRPEVIAPRTIHAGIEKACYYFNMKLHKVDLDPVTYQVDTKKVKKLINRNTVLICGSAPNYPHGIIDNIQELSDLAVKYNIPLHVDACLGSFIVTFLEKSGVHGDKPLPLFDFRLPGVTSISCDTHKYGFAPKGSSIIMYRSAELRKYQYYVLVDWDGGLYGSPTLAGSRPGALMAGCWATLLNVGESGYRDLCFEIVSAAIKARKGIESDELLSKHLEILGDPVASVIAFKVRSGSKMSIYLISDALAKKGWHWATLQNPPALHFAFTKLTVSAVDDLLADLSDAVSHLQTLDVTPTSETGALYGVAGSVHTAGLAELCIEAFLDALYKL